MEDTLTIPDAEVQTEQQPLQGDPPSKKLYNGLVEEKLYSKSYDEFIKQYNTPESISKLHDGLVEEKLYSKGGDDFLNQYFPDVKKKVGSNNLPTVSGNGLSTTPTDKNVSVQVESDPISQSLEADRLSKVTREIPSYGGAGSGNSSVPDEKSVSDAKTLQKYIQTQSGFDPIELAKEHKGLTPNDYGKEGFSKPQLLEDKATNEQLYQRKISRLKWEKGLDEALSNSLIDGRINHDQYEGINNAIKSSLSNASIGDYTQQRGNINYVAGAIKQFGGQNTDKLLSNYAVEVAKVYGNSYKNTTQNTTNKQDTPESKYLNPNAELGLQYLTDISPEKAAQYQRLFIDPKEVKNLQPDALKGYNHLMQTLEETGVNLQDNAVTEDINNLSKIAKANNGLTSEQMVDAEKLEAKKNELTQSKLELDSKYPDRITDKVDDAIQEILGQKIGWGNYAGGMVGKAIKNTGQGIWEAVSNPFMSDASNSMRELAIMGETLQDNKVYHKTDENKSFLDDKLMIKPELQAQIDAISNNKSLTREQKEKQLYPLLSQNTDKFGRVPVEGGKFNVSPSSILYSLTDIGTQLATFVGLEWATGGGATAGAVRKFISTYIAASATGFHDEYSKALMEGKPPSEAYKQGMGMTAISAAGMGGAGTAEKVRAFYSGSKSSAAQIIAGMTDEAIEKVLLLNSNKITKSLKLIYGLADRVAATPKMLAQGLKTGAEFETAMTGANELKHQLYGTEIDREQNFKQSLLGIANFGIIGAGLGHIGYKSPTELQKSGFVEFGKNPDEFKAVAQQMQKDGQLTKEQFDHRNLLIDKSAEAYKVLPKANAKGKPLSEKDKAEYIYNSVVKNEGNKAASNLPPKQAEKAEHTALVADHKNDLILEPKTIDQLEVRQKQLEKVLEPKTDTDGKPIELNEKIKKDTEAELEAIKSIKEEVKLTGKVEPVVGTGNQAVGGSSNVGGDVVDNKTKQQLLDERLNKIKEIKDKAEGTREERTKRYNELVNELGDETAALKKLQEEIGGRAKREIDKLPELPKTENEIINEKGENDFEKIKKDLGFKPNDYSWGKSPMDEDMGDMLLSKDKEAVIFIKPNEVESYDEKNDQTDTVTNGVKIELVSTKENSRGQGKAKELIQKVTNWADKNNTDLHLDIAPQDKTTTESGLKKLYESFGFEFDGIHGVRKPKSEQPLSTPKGNTSNEGGGKEVNPALKDVPIEKKNTGTEIQRDLGDGRTPVTLSGSTEAERQVAIEDRKRETKQTPLTSDRDKILERVAKYNNLNRVQKRSAYNEVNGIKLAIDSFNRKHKQKHSIKTNRDGNLEMRNNPTEKRPSGSPIKNTLKGEERNIVENGKQLTERSSNTNKVFNDLLDNDVLPVARNANGEKMSEAGHNATIQDIMDGITSNRAENYLNSLEKQIKEDNFDYGNPDKNVRTTLNDALNITVEQGEPMTVDKIEKWLKDESKLTYEDEILFDNIDNLITHYEQLHESESGTVEKVQQSNQTGTTTGGSEVKQDGTSKEKAGSTKFANTQNENKQKPITVFRSGPVTGDVAYFSETKDYADKFAGEKGKKTNADVTEMKIDPKNVLDLTDSYSNNTSPIEVQKVLEGKGVVFTSREKQQIEAFNKDYNGDPTFSHIVNVPAFIDAAKRAGFDAIKQKETTTNENGKFSNTDLHTSYAVIDPKAVLHDESRVAMEGEAVRKKYLADKEKEVGYQDFSNNNKQYEQEAQQAKSIYISKNKATSVLDKPIEDSNTAVNPALEKDLGTKARALAKELREGKKNVLPDFMRAKLPPGTVTSGLTANEAFAKALETFADIHDATKDFVKAVEEGFKHIKDYFDENKIPYNEKELKQGFENELGGGGKKPLEPMDVENDLGNAGRRFTQQMLRTDDLIPEAKEKVAKTLEYVEQTNAISKEEARKIIREVGAEEAFNLITDRNNDVNGGVRTTIGQVLIKSYNELARTAPNDTIKNIYLDKTVDVATFVTEKLGTDAGRTSQAFFLWEELSPEAQLRAEIKDKGKQGKKQKQSIKKSVDKISLDLQKANEEAANELTEKGKIKKATQRAESRLAKIGQDKVAKARAAREKILKKYRSEKGGSLYSGIGLTKEGIEFVGSTIKTYIDEGVGRLEIITDKVLQHLKDISGKPPTTEVISQVEALAKEHLQKHNDTKIGFELKNLESEVNKIVKEHYTVKGDTKKTLTDKFIEKLGLEKSESDQLAKEIQTEFDAIATRKKQALLDREIRRLNKIKDKVGGNKIERKQIQDEIIKFSNLGAFDSGQLLDVIGERLGIGKIKPEEAAKIIELAEKIQNAPEGSPKRNATEELLKYRANIKGTNWGEIAQGVWYAEVLSGYATHIRNLVSTFYNTMAFASQEVINNPRATPYLLYGMGKGLGKGVIEAVHTVRTGQTPIHISKIELPDVLERTIFKGGMLNPYNYLKYVGRLMKAEDVLLFQGLKEMRATQLAYREAAKMGNKNPFSREVFHKVNELLLNTKERAESADLQIKEEGITGRIESARRKYELMEMSRPIEMTNEAYGFAAKGTFNHNTEGTLGALSDAVSKFLDNSLQIGGTKPLRFLIPFTRIITNVANNTLDFSPIGMVRAARGKRGLFASEVSGKRVEMIPEEIRQTKIRASLGIATMAAAYTLSKIGIIQITGAGPSDIKKRLQLVEEGWQSFSIKIGDKFYSYKLTPMVFGLGIIGSIRDHEEYDKDADEQSLSDRTSLALQDGIKTIGDMTWVGSAAPLMGALAENNPSKGVSILNRAVDNSAKSFIIPNAYTQVRQKIEQVFQMPQKETNNAWQLLIKDIPFARNSMNDRINALGDPVVKDVDILSSSQNADPVWKYLFDKKGWVAPINKNTLIIFDDNIGEERPANQDEFYKFSKLRGQKIKTQIQDFIDGKTEMSSSENGFEKNKSAEEVTSKELNKWLSGIATKATDDTKKELFGLPTKKLPLRVYVIPK